METSRGVGGGGGQRIQKQPVAEPSLHPALKPIPSSLNSESSILFQTRLNTRVSISHKPGTAEEEEGRNVAHFL